jgi:type 1 fimbria pilin
MYELLLPNSSLLKDFYLMASFKFQKTALAISSAASLVLLPMLSTAQAANDSGELKFIAQIAATTCVLSLGDTAATKIGSKTINLGNYTTASTSGIANGAIISKGGDGGNGFSLGLKDSSGTTKCALGTTKWDIGVDLPATAYSTTAVTGSTVLTNQAPADVAATNIALRVTKGIGTGNASAVDFSIKANAAYGSLMSGYSVPSLGVDDTLTVFALLVKSGTGAVTPGAFQASIPLLVWYK